MAFNINSSRLRALAKATNSKTTLGSTVQDIYDSFKNKIWNIIDFISVKDSYTMANWILFKDRWIQNHNYQNTTKCDRGAIIMADLGAVNFKNEPSYEHPCIILANRSAKVLVVPCSGGAYGKGYPDVIDSPGTTHGFRKDTGVQVGQFRWINKNRILSSTGSKVNTSMLDLIDEYFLNLIPLATKRLRIYNLVLADNNTKDKRIRDLLFQGLAKDNQISILIDENKRLKQFGTEVFGIAKGTQRETVYREKAKDLGLDVIAN